MKEKSVYLRAVNFIQHKLFEEKIPAVNMTVPVVDSIDDEEVVGMCTVFVDDKDIYEVQSTLDFDSLEISLNGRVAVIIPCNETNGQTTFSIPFNEEVRQSVAFDICSKILKAHKEKLNDSNNI